MRKLEESSALDFAHVRYLGKSTSRLGQKHYVQIFDPEIELFVDDFERMENEHEVHNTLDFSSQDGNVYVLIQVQRESNRQVYQKPYDQYLYIMAGTDGFIANSVKTTIFEGHGIPGGRFGIPEYVSDMYNDELPIELLNAVIDEGKSVARLKQEFLARNLELHINEYEVKSFVGQVQNMETIDKGPRIDFNGVINAVKSSPTLMKIPAVPITNPWFKKWMTRREKAIDKQSARDAIIPNFKAKYPKGFSGSVIDGMALMKETLPVKVKSTLDNLEELEKKFGNINWTDMDYNLIQTYKRYHESTPDRIGANVKINGVVVSTGQPVAYDYYQPPAAEGGQRRFRPPGETKLQPMSMLHHYVMESKAKIDRLKKLAGLD